MSKSKAQKRQSHQPRTQAHKGARVSGRRERGTLLSVLVIIIIIHGAVVALLAWNDMQTNDLGTSSLYLPVLMLTSAADVIAGIAIWTWKKWGFQLYIGATLVMATAALMNTGSILVLFATILPTMVVAYLFLPKQKLFD